MTIEPKEAINLLESGEWFSMCYLTADTQKGASGKLIATSRMQDCPAAALYHAIRIS